MGKKDPRIDAYIAKSADFAKPILKHIRKIVHQADPDLEETLKWGLPTFMHEGIVCGMAAFKSHCVLGFWKASLLGVDDEAGAMGQFGRITRVSDLPSERKLIRLVKAAVVLNVKGVKVPRAAKTKAGPVRTPTDLMAALRRNKKALGAYESFSPGKKRDYIEWLEEAKTDATRERRLETAIEWMSEGKSRNWKYERK